MPLSNVQHHRTCREESDPLGSGPPAGPHRELDPARTPQESAPTTPIPGPGPGGKGATHLQGAWYSLTSLSLSRVLRKLASQCTCRCVVLPDPVLLVRSPPRVGGLNAPAGAWCSLTSSSRPRRTLPPRRLNAPAGAWCSLTGHRLFEVYYDKKSQCTCRCVGLPDIRRPEGVG